ncbi:MAG: M23 family metallopeptidase [Bacteroidota bacterium]
MARFIYDPENIKYEQIDKNIKSRIVRIIKWVATSLILGLLIVVLHSVFFDTPRERELRQENIALSEDYKFLTRKYTRIDTVLKELKNIDENIYRTIFEIEPVTNAENQESSLENFLQLIRHDNETLVNTTKNSLDELYSGVQLLEREFAYLEQNINEKHELLKFIPAIQPIDNPDLTRLASGYGYRMHPFYKIEKFHEGIDFTAPTGTEVYTTADGRVKELNRTRRGKGHTLVIDHGNGYETLYSHLDDFTVRLGQQVERGEQIGTVGNTGLSTAPHLHYEVKLHGETVNPVNYFFLELTPEQYDKIIELSLNSGQSFD